MSSSEKEKGFAPAWPAGTALLVYLVAALSLCWPMLQGQFLVSPRSDQFSAGYAFREFEAQFFRAHGAVPEWNPFLFGGQPFIASIPHDIFYPTAWLRWIVSTDLAMTLGFFLHLVLAGLAMYALLRQLKVQWTGALVGGLAYELTGIIASLVQPGHDGKMFVSAWAALAFLALLAAFRDHRRWGYGLFALTIGACMLASHVQLTYYLLVASGVFALWLAFLDPDRHVEVSPLLALTASALAVLLGLGISALQLLPLLDYIPYGARGANQGWEYATSYALPIEELMVGVLPQFNGILEHYWGQNPIKLHCEFLGVVTVALAVLGVTDRTRGGIRWLWVAIAGLFLLVAFGPHTPFYRLWYEVMPMMKKVRAPGMAWFLVALPTCVLAGFGADRLLRRTAGDVVALGTLGALALVGILGALGGLQPVAEAIALPQIIDRAILNADELRSGSIRLLAVALGAGAIVWLIQHGRVRAGLAATLLAAVVLLDQWSIDRRFFAFSAPAAELFADDPITTRLKATPQPYRVLDPWAGDGPATYQHSVLMSYGAMQVFGYLGNQMHAYDEMWGGKNIYQNQNRPTLWDLWAVRFIVTPQDVQLPGYHKVLGPVPTQSGQPGFLLERDSIVPYARVVSAAAKLADDQAVAATIDARFPVRELVVLSDTAQVDGPTIGSIDSLPPLTVVTARVAEWEPGRMHVQLKGTDSRPTWLLVSESWHPDWHAIVDNEGAKTYRANSAMLAVPLKPGAKNVDLTFRSAAYAKGKKISLGALLLTLLVMLTSELRFGWPSFGRRKATGAP